MKPAINKEKVSKVVSVVAKVLLPVVIVVLILQFIFMGATIYSESMKPALNKGTKVVINKLAYTKNKVRRGDIVAYTDDGRLLIKRIVGMPGETVRFQDGFVIVDDKVYEESYIPKETETNTYEKFKVPKGSYFVLGDNRENSTDSRSVLVDIVPVQNIMGKAFFRLFPSTQPLQ